jgi:hypothetical protein
MEGQIVVARRLLSGDIVTALASALASARHRITIKITINLTDLALDALRIGFADAFYILRTDVAD